MSAQAIITILLGLVLAFSGSQLAFRQRRVRRAIDAHRARKGLSPLNSPASDSEDPLHYALIISGTMMMAFGIILVGFTTMYALST